MADTNTKIFNAEAIKRENIQYVINKVYEALSEKGYDPVTQIVGYLTTGDPAYISSYNGARNLIQSVDRDDILKEMVRKYLGNE